MKKKLFAFGPSVDDLFLVFLELSLSFKTGVAPILAVNSIAERTENQLLKRTFKTIAKDLSEGETLSAAFGKHSCFPRFCGYVIQVGELSGSLYECFRAMAYNMKQMGLIRRRIFTAALPLLIALFISVFALNFLVFYVLPYFSSLFDMQSTELPFITVMLIEFSSVVSAYWYLILGIGVAAIFAGYKYLKQNVGVRDGLLLKIPFYRSIHYNFIQYKFCEIYGLLISSGMSSIVAIDKAAAAIGNEVMAQMLRKAVLSMKDGLPLAEALSFNNKGSQILDTRVIHLLESGEKTANTSDILAELSEFYRNLVEAKSQDFGNKISPIFLTFGFIIVLFIILSIYYPIITMNQGI